MGTMEEREGIRLAVRILVEKDHAAGALREEGHYKNLFPGFWDLVAEEYGKSCPPAGGRPGAPPTRVDGPAFPPPVPGETRLGPYRILQELGRGGMGVVYEAEDLRLPRRVALKVLSPQFASSAHLRLRFEREAALAAKLDHPHICAVLEAGEADGTPYLAMRYVEGKPLSDLVTVTREHLHTTGVVHITTEEAPAPSEAARRKSGELRLALERVLVLFEKVARALHAAHEKGLIHRDVKPHNIMVTAAGEPVLLDFGLARDEEGDGHQLTQSGSLMGTPAYMSPEQLMAQRIRLDRRTDVYSLGVSLYECLTLKLPFEAPTKERLYQRILTTDPENPLHVNRDLPDDLRVVLETALDKDRDRRYQTALEFAEELRRVREHEPIRARPAGVLVKMRRWRERNPALAAVIAVFVSVLVAGTALLVVLVLFLLQNWRETNEWMKESQSGRDQAVIQTRAATASRRTTEDYLRRARALALVAASEKAERADPMLALLLAREAMRSDEREETVARLAEAVGTESAKEVAPADLAALADSLATRDFTPEERERYADLLDPLDHGPAK